MQRVERLQGTDYMKLPLRTIGADLVLGMSFRLQFISKFDQLMEARAVDWFYKN